MAVDVARLIDEQPIGRFHVGLIVLCFLVMMSDGYDLQVIGYAAPGFVKMWHIDRSTLGPVFSASLVGMLFGAPLLGWLGDRYGRRRAIIGGSFLFGVFTLASVGASTQPELMVLRFLTGLGLGGLPPNTVALMAEYAPRRVRATMIVLMYIGTTVGSIMPAVVSGTLEASYGWRALFFVGGVEPILVALLLVFTLPESLKFMVAMRYPAETVRRLARRAGLPVADGAEVVVPVMVPAPRGGVPLGQLFRGDLRWITPLIWMLFVIMLMGNYFLHSWMPILFRDAGLSIRQTAVTTSMFDVGGVVGALVVSRLLDTRGFAAIAVLFLIACPAIGAIGIPGLPVRALGAVIFVAGFCLVGITLGMNAGAGLIYPTEIRAKGCGWANGIGRFGSMLGPMVGGALIGLQLPMFELFLAPVLPFAVGTLLCVWLTRLCVARYHGRGFEDRRIIAASFEQGRARG